MEHSRVRAGGPSPRTMPGVAVGHSRAIKLRNPSPSALEHARDLGRRVHNRPAPVRNGFIERVSPAGADPPLAQILRGGQGGSARLKMLLSLLWVSVRPPHETRYPARGWAALLDLPEPETNGARRINAAVTWLGAHKLVRVAPHPGGPSTIYVMDERGTGEPYDLPIEVLKEKKNSGKGISRDEYYVGLPSSFWLNGWIAVLGGPAVAMLLVLLDEAGKGNARNLWHSPSQAQQRFALSQDTRTNGLLELEAYGIIDKKRSSISPSVFDFKRVRNVYDLHIEQLEVAPGAPRPRSPVVPRSLDKEIEKELERILRGEDEPEAAEKGPASPPSSL